jgi:serine/threonine-protein kinase
MEAGALLADKYRLIAPLGDGGMGKVWMALHAPLGRTVALKVLRRERTSDARACERFRREAQAAGRLRHPGIVQPIDFGRFDDGRDYLAMEFIEGRTVKDLLDSRQVLPWPTVRRIAMQVCEALAYVHGEGIIHRDLKPSNLMVEGGDPETGRARILDLGIARISQLVPGTTLSGADGVLGTPNYAAPEQLLSSAVDPRADLYSLGVVLYRALTGRLPYRGDNFAEVAEAQRYGALEDPSAVRPDPGRPRELDDLVLELLSYRPEDRPQGADVVLERLRAMEGSRFSQVGPAVQSQAGRGALLVGAAGLGIGILLGASLVFWLAG